MPDESKKHTSLPVALLDISNQWGIAQEQTLCLARGLSKSVGFVPYVCCPQGTRLFARAQAAGFCCIPLIDGGGAYNLRSLWRLWRMQSSRMPLIVHTFSEISLRQATVLAKLRHANSTMLIHSCMRHEALQDTAQLHDDWRRVDKIVCGSLLVTNLLQNLGILREQMTIILPSVDLDTVPAKYARNDGRFVFMAIEDLEEKNSVDVLLRAMAAMWQREDLTPWEVRVVGSGSKFASLLEQAHMLGVASRLALLDNQDLSEVVPQADALVATSASVQGSWPAPAWAFALGIPLLCTSVSGHTELAGGRECGLVAEAGDAQRLAANMIRCMADEAVRQRLAGVSRDLQPRIDSIRMTKQHIDMYVRCASHLDWVLPDKTMQADMP